MKNHIGKLLMLAAIFVGVYEASATDMRQIRFRDVTPQVDDFLNNVLPDVSTDITLGGGGTSANLSMADIQQARLNNTNGIGVFNGVQIGDRVNIMGRIVTIVP